jgi:hypothetical protein
MFSQRRRRGGWRKSLPRCRSHRYPRQVHASLLAHFRRCQSGRRLRPLSSKHSMFQARMTAVVRRLAPGVPFGEGLKLSPQMIMATPPEDIGRMMSGVETAELIRRLSRVAEGHGHDSPKASCRRDVHAAHRPRSDPERGAISRMRRRDGRRHRLSLAVRGGFGCEPGAVSRPRPRVQPSSNQRVGWRKTRWTFGVSAWFAASCYRR